MNQTHFQVFNDYQPDLSQEAKIDTSGCKSHNQVNPAVSKYGNFFLNEDVVGLCSLFQV